MHKIKNSLKQHNKILIIIAALLIVMLPISLNQYRNPTIIESVLKDTSMFAGKTITSFQNKEKNQDNSDLIQKNLTASLEKEIVELKEVLELNKALTEYTIENATILSRNKSYWFNTITIDKGKRNGIKKDMAVITKNGLIGKISKVYGNSSEVKLITSDDINYKVSVSIKVNDTDNFAILNGYDPEKNLMKVTGVHKTTSANKGDIVVTSGLGGLFPSGIYVGKVESVENDKYDLSKTLYIKTEQNFNNIHYVSVLKEKK